MPSNIDLSKVVWDAPAAAPAQSAIDVSKVVWDEPKRQPGAAESLVMGVLRGGKDVIDTGAQLLASGYDKLTGADQQGVSSLVTGQKTGEAARVRAMNEAGKTEFAQEYGDSTAAKLGRVGGQIAATLPLTAAAGTGLAAAGATNLGRAVATGGLSANGAGLATRTAGGAIAGGLSAGAVDPQDAGTGAAIGAVLPGAVAGAGRAAQALGTVIRGPGVPQGIARAGQEAIDAGFVVPPTQLNPSLVNRVIEGAAGKVSTAQNASARNQALTNELAAETLGLPRSTVLTQAALEDIRKAAGQAYRDVAALPVKKAESAQPLFNKPASPEINPRQMVEDLKQARNDAQAWFRAYNRSASPDDLAKARAADAMSKQLESGLESYAASIGQDALVPALRAARERIAKTYTVERALNPVTGNVDAQTLAKLAKKGVVSGGLKTAADFATAFPKAAQSVERMGSLPQVSPLDFATAGALTAGAGPLGAAGLIARPAARAAALSGPIQRAAVQAAQRQPVPGTPLLTNPGAIARLSTLGAPVALTNLDQ